MVYTIVTRHSNSGSTSRKIHLFYAKLNGIFCSSIHLKPNAGCSFGSHKCQLICNAISEMLSFRVFHISIPVNNYDSRDMKLLLG